MKKIIFLFFVFVFSLRNSEGQITLQYSTAPNVTLQVLHLTHNGIKLYRIDSAFAGFTIYNLNNTIFRHILIPTPPINSNIFFISDSLFDTVDSTIEYAVSTFVGTTFVKVYNENGSLLFSQDSAKLSGFGNWFADGIFESNVPIFNTDSGTFMLLSGFYNGPWGSKVYKLPGSLPCVPCNGGGVSYHVAPPNGTGNGSATRQMNLNAAPNPAKNSTKVFYQLPEGTHSATLNFYSQQGALVKTFKVDDVFQFVNLSTEDIPAGTYLYNLTTPTGISTTKKLVVIK